MFLSIPLVYAAFVALFFAVNFVRSRCAPKIDIVFIVRTVPYDGRWGVVLAKHKHYLRFPMLVDARATTRFDAGTRLGPDFIAKNGRRTRLVAFTAEKNELPPMMPVHDIMRMDSELFVTVARQKWGEISMMTCECFDIAATKNHGGEWLMGR